MAVARRFLWSLRSRRQRSDMTFKSLRSMAGTRPATTRESCEMSSTSPNSRHVRIVEVEPIFSVELPAGVFSFGASTAGDLTLAHVRVRVEDRQGRSANGWGAIFLSHPWAFPGTDPDGQRKNDLMKALVTAYGSRLAGGEVWGHPLDHFLAIQPELGPIAATVAAERGIAAAIPALFSLVSLSPLDAAIHDAYGNLHGVSSYDALGADDLSWDLSRVLGDEFTGRYPGDEVRSTPAAVPCRFRTRSAPSTR